MAKIFLIQGPTPTTTHLVTHLKLFIRRTRQERCPPVQVSNWAGLVVVFWFGEIETRKYNVVRPLKKGTESLGTDLRICFRWNWNCVDDIKNYRSWCPKTIRRRVLSYQLIACRDCLLMTEFFRRSFLLVCSYRIKAVVASKQPDLSHCEATSTAKFSKPSMLAVSDCRDLRCCCYRL